MTRTASGPDVSTPVAMRVGFWFAMTLSLALAGAFVLTAVQLLPYTVAGQRVTREAWWGIALILPVVSAMSAAIAFGIRKRRAWVRHLVMLVWLTLGLATIASYVRGDLPRAVLVRALIEPAVLAVLSAWYFYVKPNVVAYFRGL